MRRWTIIQTLVIVFLNAWVPQYGARALESGDLLVGAAVGLPFGETYGIVHLVRNGHVTTFCESPPSSLDPNFWNIPKDVIVDSQGRAVFLAYMGSFFFEFQDWGLFRCDAEGAEPVLLAMFPSLPSSDTQGRPVPFPGEYFQTVSGLHLAQERRVRIDDDVDQGTPKAGTEDAYVFAAATWNSEFPPERTDVKSLRYLPSSDRWEEGPGPIKENPTGVHTPMPDLTNHRGDTYVVVHPGRLADGRGLGEMIRRIKAPLRLDLRGRIGEGEFELRLDVFGGHRDIGGGVREGGFAEIAATSFVLDDRTVPNSAECPPDPVISNAVPRNLGGGYNVLEGLGEIVFDREQGLVVTSSSIATGTPYVAQIDLAGLNDDPSDDLSQYFLRPELGCIPQRSIKFTPILPFFDREGGGNGVDRLVAGAGGLFGTQRFDGDVVRVVPGDKVETVASGLLNPVGIAAYPPDVTPGSGAVVTIRIDSPVNVLLSGPDGQRIGVDRNGFAVNEFADRGFDSGPGEPRLYILDSPMPGDYRLSVAGVEDGPYTIHVYLVDRSLVEGTHIFQRGVASPGSSEVHPFSLLEDGSISFVPEVEDLPAVVTGLAILAFVRSGRRGRRSSAGREMCAASRG